LAGYGGLPLYAQAWLPEGQPAATLAIVHGFGEHSGRYMNVVNALTPRGYAIFGFDWRGHGRSTGQRGHVQHWDEVRGDVGALVRWAAQQQPGQPHFLYGHSLGALAALEYVLHEPGDLKGVIASGAALGQVGISPLLQTLSRIMSRVWPRLSINTGLDASTISRDPQAVQAYRSDPLVHSLGTARLGTEVARAQVWTQTHAADLRVPLLMIHGDADRLIPPDSARTFFAHVTLADKERREYAGAYHEVHNDICADEMLRDVLQWLERHRA
jgi:alpha-beta hydrolase superfamily lysophospholipase